MCGIYTQLLRASPSPRIQLFQSAWGLKLYLVHYLMSRMIINVKDQIIGYVFVSQGTQSMCSNIIVNSTKMFNQFKSQKKGIYSLKVILPVERKAKMKDACHMDKPKNYE